MTSLHFREWNTEMKSSTVIRFIADCFNILPKINDFYIGSAVKWMVKSPLDLWHGRIIFEKKTSVLTKHFKIRFSEAQLSAPVYMQCMSYSTFCYLEMLFSVLWNIIIRGQFNCATWNLWRFDIFCFVWLSWELDSVIINALQSLNQVPAVLYLWQSRKVSWNAK